MRILVTGCCGFIGHRTTEMLLEKGSAVFGIDNLNDYYDVRLKNYRLKRLKRWNDFRFKKIDFLNRISIDKLFEENDFAAVIHLGGMAGVRQSVKDPHIYVQANVLGTLNILEGMRVSGVKKLVTASTSSLYAGQELPFSEVNDTSLPISPYAASKKAAEVMSYTYHYLHQIDVSILRYFTVYGPAGRPDMSYFRFIKSIDEGFPIVLYGDGSQGRDFTYVDDVALGTILALKKIGYEIINLGGSNNPVAINYLIAKTEEYLGKRAKIIRKPIDKADIPNTQADITKAKKLLGWSPKVTFDEGLKMTLEWYKENRRWLKSIKLAE
ncbi:MAG: GDP-mannose 4,6-dehydratase [Patescibacteria group bacterium]